MEHFSAQLHAHWSGPEQCRCVRGDTALCIGTMHSPIHRGQYTPLYIGDNTLPYNTSSWLWSNPVGARQLRTKALRRRTSQTQETVPDCCRREVDPLGSVSKTVHNVCGLWCSHALHFQLLYSWFTTNQPRAGTIRPAITVHSLPQSTSYARLVQQVLGKTTLKYAPHRTHTHRSL